MSRYYELTVSGPGGDYVLDATGLGITQGTGPIASSLYTDATSGGNAQLVGQVNPRALQIEFDLPVTQLHQPRGSAWIRLWGIGLRALGQAANLNSVNGVFKTFVLKAGMSKGLPLANPNQAGIIAQGSVFQAFGNWQGVTQTLDLLAMPGPVPPTDGSGISFKWDQGQAVGDAISQTLAQSMPGYKANVNISASLIAPYALPGWYPDFNSWANAVRRYTQSLGKQQYGDSYQGVQIGVSKNVVNVYDGQGPTAPTTIALAFQDLIGQPTWISPAEVSFQTVTRADIDLGNQITFPAGIMPPYALTSPDAAVPNAPAASSIAFQGKFVINSIHHYGSSRQADAAAWNTTFRAVATKGAGVGS